MAIANLVVFNPFSSVFKARMLRIGLSLGIRKLGLRRIHGGATAKLARSREQAKTSLVCQNLAAGV